MANPLRIRLDAFSPVIIIYFFSVGNTCECVVAGCSHFTRMAFVFVVSLLRILLSLLLGCYRCKKNRFTIYQMSLNVFCFFFLVSLFFRFWYFV